MRKLEEFIDSLYDNKYFLIGISITMWIALVIAIRYAIS